MIFFSFFFFFSSRRRHTRFDCDWSSDVCSSDLNPERVSMPDIDLDFCFERRSEVIEYVRARYGRESVGQIITFGTLKARAAFRDVARTLRVEMGDVDRITKLIPSGPAFALTLAEAAEKVPEVKAAAAQDERIRKVLNLGARIEGLARHASVHAAGLVIAPGPLADYVPVCIAPQDTDAIITQYDMVSLEQAGMLKIDLLGLKTLTVIHDAVQMIQERHGVAVDPPTLDLEDAAVYELLRSGRTAGVFQFESPLATDCLRNMKCDRFDDLVATNALMRPGPLDSGMHLVFIRRKRGDEPVRYPHAALRDVLEPTYGVIVYQEQVMRIANVLAGYSLAEADVLRKAVGKKDKELLQRELGPFVERAVARGHDRRTMEDIAAQIETFGRYGFPKAHSVAYRDRKSTRLNSSHSQISYAVFCLKKKKNTHKRTLQLRPLLRPHPPSRTHHTLHTTRSREPRTHARDTPLRPTTPHVPHESVMWRR